MPITRVRRVRSSGEIMWRGDRVFVSEAVVGEPVGIAELETGNHVVRFCDRDVGLIDRPGRFRRFAPPISGCAKPPPIPLVVPKTGNSRREPLSLRSRQYLPSFVPPLRAAARQVRCGPEPHKRDTVLAAVKDAARRL